MSPNDKPANFLQYLLKSDSRYSFMATLRTFEIGHMLFIQDIDFGWERRALALDLKRFGPQNPHRKK